MAQPHYNSMPGGDRQPTDTYLIALHDQPQPHQHQQQQQSSAGASTPSNIAAYYNSFASPDETSVSYADKNGRIRGKRRKQSNIFSCVTVQAFLSFLTTAPAFALAAFVWIILSSSFSLAFLIFFPISLLIVMASAASWRILGKIELWANSFDSSDIKIIPKYFPQGQGCISSGIAICKALLTNSFTWRCVAYFLFVFFPLCISAFSILLSMTAISLGLMFNIVIRHYCKQCENPTDANWGDLQTWSWIVYSDSGSIITVPAGLVVLFLTITLARGFNDLRRKSAFSVLLQHPSLRHYDARSNTKQPNSHNSQAANLIHQ